MTETKVSREALSAMLDIYDAIPAADRVCRPCQSSDFRGRVVAKAANAAKSAEAIRKAVEKAPKSGIVLTIQHAQMALELFDGIRNAESAYEYDQRGDMAFRNWCLGAYKALNIAAAFEAVREALEASKTEDAAEATETA